MQLIKTCIQSSDHTEVKMLIVENVTEAEADGLRRIIEQQANEIVELETRLEFSSKTLHLQSPSCKESLLDDKIKCYTAFVSRNVLDTVWSWNLLLLYRANKEPGQGTSTAVIKLMSSPPSMKD